MGLQLPKRARTVGTWTVVASCLLTLGACANADQEQIKRLAMPVPATDRAPLVQDLWEGAWLAAILTGILVWGLIGYAAFRFRRRHDDEIPVQTRYNLPIEILYTIVPVVMVLVFFFFTVDTQNKLLASAEGGKADHTIKVVGQKWAWTFNYMNEDAVDGDSVFTVGALDDLPTLVLPVDESVDIELSSPDVIHSFWVPSFLFKLDVIPGGDNGFSFTPTREGTYRGKCAELCGVYHSRMLFDVEVVSADEYAVHLQELKGQGNVGTALGGADSTTQPGLDPDNASEQGDAE